MPPNQGTQDPIPDAQPPVDPAQKASDGTDLGEAVVEGVLEVAVDAVLGIVGDLISGL